MESCMDMIISGGEESLRGMNNALWDPTLRKKFDECDCKYHSRFKESQRKNTYDVSYPLDLDAKNSTNILYMILYATHAASQCQTRNLFVIQTTFQSSSLWNVCMQRKATKSVNTAALGSTMKTWTNALMEIS